MSLPDEYVRAQERIVQGFIDDKFDRKQWPKHLINGIELKMLFEQVEELREENRILRDVVTKITNAVVEYEQEVEGELKKNPFQGKHYE